MVVPDFRGELVVMWRCACWAKVGGPVLGLLGGMVSSTATSMSFARQVRRPQSAAFVSATVIQWPIW